MDAFARAKAEQKGPSEKAKEGFIDKDTERKILGLLDRYAMWR